jgi:hypothetical protein
MPVAAQFAASGFSLSSPDVHAHFLDSLHAHGFALITDCYSPDQVQRMKAAVLTVESAYTPDDPSFLTSSGQLWAIWNLYDHSPSLLHQAMAHAPMSLTRQYFQEDAHLCRATLMKKSPVTPQTSKWHQDRSGPVDRDEPGPENSGVRAGVPHRHLSPITIQRHYLIARIHLEHQYPDAGSVMLVPGSHKLGLLPTAQWALHAASHPQVCINAAPGSVLFMLPNTIHASGPNTRKDPQNHRRVIHNEFRSGSSNPCDGFSWFPSPHSAVIQSTTVAFTHLAR